MNFCRPKSSMLVIAAILLAIATAPTMGQSTKPAKSTAIAQADQAIENQPLQISDGDAKPAELRSSSTAAGTSNTSDLLRIVFALAIVIGVILLLRAGVRRMSSLPGAGKGKLVTVLSRSMISPRQQILVLQVGRRLLVVGDSGGSMSQLCELTDPDEIASLIGQTRQGNDVLSEGKKVSFGNMFRRANQPFDDLDEAADDKAADDKADEIPQAPSVEEVGGLLEKIKLLQQQYKLKT